MDKRALKREHEQFIGDTLVETLGLKPADHKLGNDHGEPDIIYKIDNRGIGIEIATAYYEDGDAREEWTLARGERGFAVGGIEPRVAGPIGNPDEVICDRIQRELDDKCAKRYTGADEIWLCIEQRAALSDAHSVEACIERLRIPESGFQKIYLFYQAPLNDGGGYRAVKLYEHA